MGLRKKGENGGLPWGSALRQSWNIAPNSKVEDTGCFGLFLFVQVGWDIASRERPWMAIWREETPKMGFPLPAVPYLAENLSGLKIFCSLSFIDRELLCFPPIFPFYFIPIFWSGILLFLSFHFLFSFFSFLPFLSFHFSFSIPFFGKSGFSILFALPWGDSAVLCFGGKDEDSFYRPRFKIF